PAELEKIIEGNESSARAGKTVCKELEVRRHPELIKEVHVVKIPLQAPPDPFNRNVARKINIVRDERIRVAQEDGLHDAIGSESEIVHVGLVTQAAQLLDECDIVSVDYQRW